MEKKEVNKTDHNPNNSYKAKKNYTGFYTEGKPRNLQYGDMRSTQTRTKFEAGHRCARQALSVIRRKTKLLRVTSSFRVLKTQTIR